MSTSTTVWTEEQVEAGGARIQLAKGGSGEPLLILHDEMGHHEWLRYQEALAGRHTLYIPSHPGFGKSERLDWVMNMRDYAGWYLEALDDLGLDQVSVVGFSLGGWLAAEIAAMCPHRFKKLVLVGAAGIKPPVGEIYDMFLVTAREYIETTVLDPSAIPEFQRVCPEEPPPELAEAWEVAREQACRLTWRPYMHYPALPHLLGRLRSLPTLVVWGREDAIVPLSAGGVYHQSIEGSRLAVVDDCGHRPEIEKPTEFVELVEEFLGAG
jgi:pimeloyl-ACP methyl ester carboxylesterase